MKQSYSLAHLKVYKFMFKSLPRLHVLRKNIADDELDSALTLKHNSDTRWLSRKKVCRRHIVMSSSALQHIGRHNRGKGDFFDPKGICRGTWPFSAIKNVQLLFRIDFLAAGFKCFANTFLLPTKCNY